MRIDTEFKKLVGKSIIKMSISKGVVSVTTQEVDNCEYAFYLLKDGAVEEKVFYSDKPYCRFHSTPVPFSTYAVKIFYRRGGEKHRKITKPLMSEVKQGYIMRKVKKELSLDDCEISGLDAEKKIKQYEDVGFKPRVDCNPVALNIPINWLEDPLKDRNWMYQLNAWRMLDPYLARFSEQDHKLISQVINDWVFYEKNNKGVWLWYDMSTGLRALKISYYLAKCDEIGVSHNIEDLDYLVTMHLKYLSNPDELNTGNHGLFQLNGLKSLLYILDDFESCIGTKKNLSKYALDSITKLIYEQLGEEGVHTEHSPDYHFFVHKKLVLILAAPWWNEINGKIKKLINKAEDAKPWLLFPNGKCVPVGDSSSGSVLRTRSPLENWPHEKVGESIAAKLDGYAVVRSLSSVPLKRSHLLFFQGAFYSHTHKHSDDLSFVLQDRGEDILIDSGKYGYQQDKFRKYFLSTPAHNTITVDGLNTSRNKKDAYGSAIQGAPKFQNKYWIIKGAVDHKNNEYSHHRIIFYRPGWELYILDVIKNKATKNNRNVSQWWHFSPKAKVSLSTEEAGEISVTLVDSNRKFYVQHSSSMDEVDSVLYKGNEKNPMSGWVSNSYLNYEPTTSLRFSSKLDEVNFSTTRFLFKVGLPSLLECRKGKVISENLWVLNEIDHILTPS